MLFETTRYKKLLD